MIPTLSASSAASSMSCVVRMRVTSESLSSRRRSQTKRRAAGSSPVVGSSRKSTRGRVHERAGDHHPLTLSAGEEVGLVAGAVEQPELVEQLVGPLLALARRHAVVGGVEDEVVPDRDGAVEVALLRHDGELRPRPHRIADHVHPADAGRPGSGPDASRQHPDSRRLSGPVGAEQAEHLAGGGGEGHAVDRVHGRLRIPLDEVANLDREAFGLRWNHLEILRSRSADRALLDALGD